MVVMPLGKGWARLEFVEDDIVSCEVLGDLGGGSFGEEQNMLLVKGLFG